MAQAPEGVVYSQKSNETEVLFIYIPVISTPHKNGDGCEKGHVDEDWGRAVAVAVAAAGRVWIDV